jgi:hypothetical protein
MPEPDKRQSAPECGRRWARAVVVSSALAPAVALDHEGWLSAWVVINVGACLNKSLKMSLPGHGFRQN